jgi:hypothetical protein
MRVRLGTVLRVELGLVVLFVLLGVFVPVWRGFLLNSSCVVLIAVILQALILPFRGPDLVLYDEAPDSPLKYYWFAVIFVAVFSGNLLGGLLRTHFGLT